MNSNPLINLSAVFLRHSLTNSGSNKQLVINSVSNGEQKYRYEFKTLSFFERFKNYFHLGVSPSIDTWKNLKVIVGEKRLERIFLKKELGLSYKLMQSNQILLTPKIVHRILIGLADIRVEDLEEVVPNANLSQLNVRQLDEIYHQLFPLEKKIKEIFFRHCQEVADFDKPKTGGKGFKGLQERVWCIIKARDHFIEKSESNKPEKLQGMEVELLTSRLGDREPSVGSVVRLKDNYYEVKKVFTGGGACVSLWQQVGGSKTLITCRGTAIRYSAQSGYLSGVNDLLPEIGFFGVKKIWPELKRYLQDNQVEQVEILGKSLGGAHAQYLTTLIAGTTSTQVTSLQTYCSVGTPPKVHEVFQDIFAENVSMHEPEVRIFRNTGEGNLADYIPTLGGAHLRSNQTSVYYMASKGSRLEDPYIPAVTGFQRYFTLLQSFGLGHTHQTTLKPFHIYQSMNIDQEVLLGTKMEKVRSYVAKVFNILTLTLFNRQNFESFYHQEKQGVV